jgi:YVTN family beta-propeller protein
MGLVAQALSLLGLNGPKAPANPVGAAVWGLVRTLAWQNGYLPMKSVLTNTREPVTGVVTGTQSFTVSAGVPLSYRVTVAPIHGEVTVDATGAFIYTPAGTPVTDSFTITASDGLAATSTIVSLPVVTTTVMPKAYDLQGITISPNGTRLYVTNAADVGNGHGTVVVLDAATKAVIATIDAGTTPQAMVLSPDGKHLYVANWNQANNSFPVTVNGGLSVIDTATNSVTSTVEVGHGPSAIAVSPDGARVYVANEYDDTVSVIDTATSAVLKTIPVGRWPLAVAISPDGSRAYVSDSDAFVSVIDTATATVSATLPVGPRPRAGTWPWTGGFSSSDIALTVSPDGSALYVINDNSSGEQLWEVDTATNKVVGKVSVPVAPSALVVSPDVSSIYITNCENNSTTGCTTSAWVVDTATRTVTNIIPVGDPTKNIGPTAIAISPDGHHVYATTSGYYGLSPEFNYQAISDITV